MEIKILRKIEYLPKVFMLRDLNKFAITEKYVNCARYTSRSGKTQEGCIIYSSKDAKETRGIFYVPAPPVVELKFRRKGIKDIKDVITLLDQINPIPRLSDMELYVDKVLVEWHNYGLRVYERFSKGLMLEFPTVAEQGHLKIYKTVPPSDAYFTSADNNSEKRTLNEAVFEKLNKVIIYNHEINFSSQEVLKYRYLTVFPGMGELIYVKDGSSITVTSPDHEKVELSVEGGTWLLFSHRRPPRSTAD